jgi:hypothetical protein
MSSYRHRNWIWLPVGLAALWITLRVVTAQAVVPRTPGTALSAQGDVLEDVVDPELEALLARLAARPAAVAAR